MYFLLLYHLGFRYKFIKLFIFGPLCYMGGLRPNPYPNQREAKLLIILIRINNVDIIIYFPFSIPNNVFYMRLYG